MNSSIAHTDRGYPDIEIFSTADASGGGPTTFLITQLFAKQLTEESDDADINKQIQESGIPDPNALFRSEVLRLLSEDYAVSNLGPDGVVLNEKASRIDFDSTNTDAQYIVDTNIWWRAMYVPLKWNRFRFFFQFRMQIHDRKGKLIFKDVFAWKTPPELGYPTQSEFLTNQERGIEAQIQAAMSEALDYYKMKLD